MKRYTSRDENGFKILITWDESRSILRIESGPEEFPQEMIAQFEGLSKWGAQCALDLWILQMIDGGNEEVPLILRTLGLPEKINR